MKVAPEGVNWGTTNIPEEKWIDPSKVYKTACGKRVVDLHINLHNSNGNEVTYPVKGTIVLREKPFKTTYAIWTLDGRASCIDNTALWDSHDDLDLVEVV